MTSLLTTAVLTTEVIGVASAAMTLLPSVDGSVTRCNWPAGLRLSNRADFCGRFVSGAIESSHLRFVEPRSRGTRSPLTIGGVLAAEEGRGEWWSGFDVAHGEGWDGDWVAELIFEWAGGGPLLPGSL